MTTLLDPMLRRERAELMPDPEDDLHPLIAAKLWDNPSWLSFRINYLGLQFDAPVYGLIEQRYGLVRPEYVVLYSLYLMDGIAAKDVCASAGFPKNTISRAISKLLRRNFIQRAPALIDRRSYVLRLTLAGRRIIDETVALIIARERLMWRASVASSSASCRSCSADSSSNLRADRQQNKGACDGNAA